MSKKLGELEQEVEEHYKQICTLLPAKVKCKSVDAPINERIPFKAELFRAGQIYRVVDITESIMELLSRKKLIPATILVRCVYESAALCFMVYRRLKQVVETNKLGDIDNFLTRAGVGGRSVVTPQAPNGSVVEALNISKAIRSLNKKFPNISEDYGFLCDFTHPNCPSGIIGYGKLDMVNDIYNFSLDASYKNMDKPEEYVWIVLCVSLVVFRFYYEDIENILPKFTEICNANKR